MKRELLTAMAVSMLALPLWAEDSRPDTTGWFENPAKLDQQGGAEIYRAVCAACHMPDGRGAVGAGMYPALAGNENLAYPDYPVHVVLNGLRAMPALGGQLDDQQVADVVNYVRTSFGNAFTEEPATAELVAGSR